MQMKADTIEVIYEDGVFKPLQKVRLKPHTRGRVLLSPPIQETQHLLKAQKSALKKIAGIGSSSHKDTARRHNEYIYGLKAH
jgi:predicted DNA-binding antitoxin AbrB/MazE fold protein